MHADARRTQGKIDGYDRSHTCSLRFKGPATPDNYDLLSCYLRNHVRKWGPEGKRVRKENKNTFGVTWVYGEVWGGTRIGRDNKQL